MITGTKKALAIAALIVATGVFGVELTRGSAQAEEPQSTAARINAAFDVVAEMPPVEPVSVPMATKGDLPIPLDCVRMTESVQAECTELAYRVLTAPSFVVATSFGNTTTLLRMDAMAVAELLSDIFGSDG